MGLPRKYASYLLCKN